MQKFWDGSNWGSQNALKVWTGSAWITNAKLKARTSISWLPTASSDVDVAQVVKWSVEAPTPPPPPPPVTHIVPDLDLMTLTQLEAALSPLNFGYTIAGYEVTAISDRDDKVVIDSQIPASGQLLAEGLDVSIRLYNFVQPTTTVPNLNLLLTSQADTQITNANLIKGSPIDEVQTYDGTLIGKVVPNSQYPTAGSTVDTGTAVIYERYVQQPFSTVPNLVGTDEDNVFTALSNTNLTTGTRTTFATSTQNLDGKIKSTSPVSGTQVQQGSAVAYVVNEHSLAIVPNLVGLTSTQADTALDTAFLNTGSITYFETTVVADEGKVKSQSTAAGSTVGIYSSVSYVVNVPNTTIAVPSLNGQTLQTVGAFLATFELSAGLSGLTYTNDTNLHNRFVPNTQSPTAGTVVNINSVVTANYYAPFPTFTVPSIVGLLPSSGAINANFNWGSNSLGSTGTQTVGDVGKVATQSPAAGTSAQAGNINYGVFSDARPTVPNVVGQAQSTAQTNITNVGLNHSTTFQNQSFNGQATAGTVASQSPASGTRLTSGLTVSIVVWNAYVPQPVTRTATVYVGDDALNGWMNQLGQQFSTPSSNLDWKWQAHYRLLNSTGNKVSESTYIRMKGFVGYQSATNGKQAMTYRASNTEVDSWIKANITNNASYTTGNVDFVFSVGSDGNNGKLWFLDWMANTTSSPFTYTDANRVNTQSVSNINNGDTMSVTLNSTMKLYSWTNGYGLGVAAGVTASNASITYGSINWAYFAAQISWTEFV